MKKEYKNIEERIYDTNSNIKKSLNWLEKQLLNITKEVADLYKPYFLAIYERYSPRGGTITSPMEIYYNIVKTKEPTPKWWQKKIHEYFGIIPKKKIFVIEKLTPSFFPREDEFKFRIYDKKNKEKLTKILKNLKEKAKIVEDKRHKRGYYKKLLKDFPGPSGYDVWPIGFPF